MPELVEFSISSERPELSVVVEAPPGLGSGEVLVGREEDVVERAHETFENAVGRLRPMIDVLVENLRSSVQAPDTVSVSFGVRFSGKVGAIVTSAEAEANMTVTLTWSNPGT
jgi:hypothetical protein